MASGLPEFMSGHWLNCRASLHHVSQSQWRFITTSGGMPSISTNSLQGNETQTHSSGL